MATTRHQLDWQNVTELLLDNCVWPAIFFSQVIIYTFFSFSLIYGGLGFLGLGATLLNAAITSVTHYIKSNGIQTIKKMQQF